MWGGKRSGSGRNKRRAEEKTDWNMYKKEAKAKKLKEAAKSTMDLKNFFVKKEAFTDQSSKNDSVTDFEEEVNDIMDEGKEGNDCQNKEKDDYTLQVPSPLPFFKNGCKAPGMSVIFLFLELMSFSHFRMPEYELYMCY